MNAAPQTTRVLIRLSALGDLVLCSALARRLAREHPGDELVLVTSKSLQAFAEAAFPAAARIEGLRRPALGLPGWFLSGWMRGARLGRGDTLEIYDLHGVSKSHFWLWGLRLKAKAAGCAVRVFATPKHSFSRWLSILLGRDLLGARHVYRAHLNLAGPLTDDKPELRLAEPPPARDPKRILIAPDAQHWKKRWVVSHWEQLLDRLLAHPARYAVTLVGLASSLPQDLRDELQDAHGDRVTDLLGRTELPELPRIAAAHAATVCGNSAWLHISEAMGTPVVTLAGPIVPGFGFSPWRAESRELSVALDCRPCTKHGGGPCRRIGDDFHACMKKITPDSVWQALRAILEK